MIPLATVTLIFNLEENDIYRKAVIYQLKNKIDLADDLSLFFQLMSHSSMFCSGDPFLNFLNSSSKLLCV